MRYVEEAIRHDPVVIMKSLLQSIFSDDEQEHSE